MTDWAARVRALGQKLDAGYDRERTSRALVQLHSGLRRRRRRRLVAGAGGVLAGTTAVLLCVVSSRHVSPPGPLLTLTDGSVVQPLDDTSRVVTQTVSPQLVQLELRSGAARFDVQPNAQREFRVEAGHVAVAVLGTRFSVARQGERSEVQVERGRVRVEWRRGQQILEAGERGIFPPVQPTVEALPPGPVLAPSAPDPAPAPAAEPSRPPHAHAVPTEPDWRALAQRGEFAEAYAITGDKVPPATLSALDDLLLAADVARNTRHPASAVAYLKRALALHGHEERAAQVAFTLGRVLQSELHDWASAASAYAQARAAAPTGSLAEDALAREVEMRFQAGDRALARQLAEEYMRIWPTGSRERTVRYFGGLR